MVPEPPNVKLEEIIPEEYKPTQCPFCIGNASKPHRKRMKPFSKVNKMWNHIENVHDCELAAFATGRKCCSICEERDLSFIPSDIRHFKSHTAKMHKISLRP
jgi:hypothetical protein